MLHAQRHQQFTTARRKIVRCVRLSGVYVKYAQQCSVRSVERKRHVLVRLNCEHRRDFQRHSAGVVTNLNHRGVVYGNNRNRYHARCDQLRQRALVARLSLIAHCDRQLFRLKQRRSDLVVVVHTRRVNQTVQRRRDVQLQALERQVPVGAVIDRHPHSGWHHRTQRQGAMVYAQRHQQLTTARRKIVRCVRLFSVYVKYAQQRSVCSVERKRHVLVRRHGEHRRGFQRYSPGGVINLNHRGVVDGNHRDWNHARRRQRPRRIWLVARLTLIVNNDRQRLQHITRFIPDVVVVVQLRCVNQTV